MNQTSDTPETFSHPVCRYCGSADITCDAVARYNKHANDWELSSTFDGGNCNACGEEMKYFDWVDTPYEDSSKRSHDGIHIAMGTMKESNGRITYSVIINRNGKQVQTDHNQRKNRTEYAFAEWKHVLLGGPKPNLMEYQDDPEFKEVPYHFELPKD